MYLIWSAAFALMLGITILLIALGLPVAFAFLGADVIGVMLFMGGEAGLAQLVRNAANALTRFALVPVPLFLIMGELFFHSGLGFRAFNALDKLFGRLPGRLSFVTVGGGHHVCGVVRFQHGIHRIAGDADGAGDVETRL